MNLAKHIRKPMPAPSSAHKGVKDSPRSKTTDHLTEWDGWEEHLSESAANACNDDECVSDEEHAAFLAHFANRRSNA